MLDSQNAWRQTAARKIMVVALLLLVGCRSSSIVTHPLNIEDMTPLEFLIHLKSCHKGDCQYVRSVTEGWVKEEHLPHLFDLLDSDEKCALPVSAFSSPHVDMGTPWFEDLGRGQGRN
jgi:hypothetical protein